MAGSNVVVEVVSELCSVTVMEWLAPESLTREAASVARGRVRRAVNSFDNWLPIAGWEVLFERETQDEAVGAVRNFYRVFGELMDA